MNKVRVFSIICLMLLCLMSLTGCGNQSELDQYRLEATEQNLKVDNIVNSYHRNVEMAKEFDSFFYDSFEADYEVFVNSLVEEDAKIGEFFDKDVSHITFFMNVKGEYEGRVVEENQEDYLEITSHYFLDDTTGNVKELIVYEYPSALKYVELEWMNGTIISYDRY